MLGVSQGRLSTLLGRPRPWDQLALYARLHLWMDTRATYGNNPHAKYEEKERKIYESQ